jgi:hypothetical protein
MHGILRYLTYIFGINEVLSSSVYTGTIWCVVFTALSLIFIFNISICGWN